MGSASTGNQYNAYERNRLDWLPSSYVQTAASSGTYRIHAFDKGSLASGNVYALKVLKDADRDYWLDFRQNHTGNKWLMSGVDLHWDPWAQSNGGSQLLDTTPGTSNGKNDSAIVIGRTFSDAGAGIHLTPIRKGGTTPESIDVVVNLGTFSGNSAPTLNLSASATAVGTGITVNFTSGASDPNGDTLAYFWDFGDNTFGANAATASKSWSAAKEYVVRCVVSDMRGGETSDYVVVTVGAPANFRIAGRVTNGGAGLQGARVHNGLPTNDTNYRTAWTDKDGYYEMVDLPAGSYTVGAVKYGYALSAAFANPVVVGPNAGGIDFTASMPTYAIGGTVTSAGAAVSGVTVSDGFRSVLTASNGSFTISGVPAGSYTLTAVKSGLSYNPNGWSNPVVVDGANVTGRNFVAPLYSISGEISGVTSSVTVSDGTRSTTSYQTGGGKNKRWVYTLSGVPQGTYTLTATLTGYTLVPSGWTNPVSVTSNRTGMNFAAGGGSTAYTVSGEILGVAQAVTVSDGTRSTTSKLTGKGKNAKWTYSLTGVPAGTYTLTASLAGYVFTPANFTNPVTVSANLTSRNFQGVAAGQFANEPPVIMSSPWASPARIRVANATKLGVVAYDPDEGPDDLIYIWTKVSGPGQVYYSDNCTVDADQVEARFSKPGTYVLRVTVHDGDDADTDTVKVVVVR
ncbi:MAG: PKD domain-containing protein [Planctomycetota bacterium]|nr:PKD domain-containing protein [Planctomycetota bacterium]